MPIKSLGLCWGGEGCSKFVERYLFFLSESQKVVLMFLTDVKSVLIIGIVDCSSNFNCI